MRISMPTTVEHAVEMLQTDSRSTLLSGGTDLMVGVNFGRTKVDSVISLRRLQELKGWRDQGDFIVLGAGLTFAEMLAPEFERLAPALAQAARTVGSPQIRSTATLGGNLGTASPAGDSLPVLYAMNAVVTLTGPSGQRSVPVNHFITGAKRTVREPDELIVSVTIPKARGAQEFLKVGNRNAMVIALASLAVIIDPIQKSISCALGSVGPTVIRCWDAEKFISTKVDWLRQRLDDTSASNEFSALCAAAAHPIDDHRSTALYRRHAISILAQRALQRTL
jgi:CO/xanthine dehydrogenase FAD-binding subunit